MSERLHLVTSAGVRFSQQVSGTTVLSLASSGLLGVDNLSSLRQLIKLSLSDNTLIRLPDDVYALTKLQTLMCEYCSLVDLSPRIGALGCLVELWLSQNSMTALPREIGLLARLRLLTLHSNKLATLPAEIGALTALVTLDLCHNALGWLPVSMHRLNRACFIEAFGNPLPVALSTEFDEIMGRHEDVNCRLDEIFAATASLLMLREEATTLAIGLQDLELPALVTLEIIDAAFPNSILMHKKWNLITTIKHWRRA